MKKTLISLVILSLCFVLGFGVRNLKDYYDDRKVWQNALSINTGTSYRNYLHARPQGRWRPAASQQLEALYDLAGRSYIESRSGGFDPQASEAVLQVLDYAKRTQHHEVIVTFERQKNVNTLADNKLEAHQGSTFGEIKVRFEQVIPNDILNFIQAGSPGENVVFLIKYKVDPTKGNYADERTLNTELLAPTTYHGISINWEFGIQIPSRANVYRVNVQTEPDKKVKFWPQSSVQQYDSDKAAVLDGMAYQSFFRFRRDLITRFGLLK